MTFPLIQTCFLPYSLHMWTYQRPNGTQEHVPLNHPEEHFCWEAIRGIIVRGFTFVRPDNCVSWLASSTGKTPTSLRSAQHMRISVIICLSAWMCRRYHHALMFIQLNAWVTGTRRPDYPAWPATINPSESPGPSHSPYLKHTHTRVQRHMCVHFL